MPAQVVRPALEQGHADRPPERAADRGQVAMEELVLECPRAGRDDHAPARHERRHEVSERLARPRARLDDEGLPALHGRRHVLGHGELAVAHDVSGERLGERPVRAEQFFEVRDHGQRKIARNRSSAVAPGASGRRRIQRTWVYVPWRVAAAYVVPSVENRISQSGPTADPRT